MHTWVCIFKVSVRKGWLLRKQVSVSREDHLRRTLVIPWGCQTDEEFLKFCPFFPMSHELDKQGLSQELLGNYFSKQSGHPAPPPLSTGNQASEKLTWARACVSLSLCLCLHAGGWPCGWSVWATASSCSPPCLP